MNEKSSIETITPAKAEKWLALNGKNRKPRQHQVDAFARDMASGNWYVSPDAITFDTNGAMRNGQHRLAAIVKAEVPIRALVLRGMDPKAFDVVDTGSKRVFADVLYMDGVPNRTNLAAAVKIDALWQAGVFTQGGKRTIPRLTHSELAYHLASNPGLHYAVKLAQPLYAALRINWAAGTVFIHRVNQIVTNGGLDMPSSIEQDKPGLTMFHRFLHEIVKGVDLRESAPTLALRSWAINRMNEGGHVQSPSSRVYLAYLATTWNFVALGEQRNQIRIPRPKGGGDPSVPLLINPVTRRPVEMKSQRDGFGIDIDVDLEDLFGDEIDVVA